MCQYAEEGAPRENLYRAAYPGEIGARIELHRRETAAADTL